MRVEGSGENGAAASSGQSSARKPGIGFRVEGLGFRIQGLGFRV